MLWVSQPKGAGRGAWLCFSTCVPRGGAHPPGPRLTIWPGPGRSCDRASVTSAPPTCDSPPLAVIRGKAGESGGLPRQKPGHHSSCD